MDLPIISTSVYTSGQGSSFMAYVPGCRYDVFISYADENNQDGWVEQFEKTLRKELGELTGGLSVFFDKSILRAGQSFSDELRTAARDSAILIPVLTPHYFKSSWCDWERIEFFRKLPYGAEAKQCLAPILVRPINQDQLPALYRHAQQMSFLSEDKQTPLPPESSQWILRLRELARQLQLTLNELKNKCKPIFLGRVPAEEWWKKLRTEFQTELEEKHFRIVPEYIHAIDDPEVTLNDLKAAGLAVHFLGGSDPASRKTIETSMTICNGPTLLFQPPEAKLTPDEKLWLYEFEDELQPAPGKYHRLEGKNNQELFSLINELMALVPVESDGSIARANLALICEEEDLDGVRQIQAEMRTKHRIGIEFPDFFGQQLKAERSRKLDAYLSRGKAFLFYYGASRREWLDLVWEKVEHHWPNARRSWFLAPPNFDQKRKQYPDALWQIDQVIRFFDPDPERNTQ